ncbi:unnamed protein product, partial [Prorocentrum cordatum]
DIENYRDKFKTFDGDQSGEIDRQEFSALMYSLTKLKPGAIPAQRMQGWWRAADTDGNGSISFGEFVNFHQKFFSAPDASGKTDLAFYYGQTARRPSSRAADANCYSRPSSRACYSRGPEADSRPGSRASTTRR